jgi:hypothetical protein
VSPLVSGVHMTHERPALSGTLSSAACAYAIYTALLVWAAITGTARAVFAIYSRAYLQLQLSIHLAIANHPEWPAQSATATSAPVVSDLAMTGSRCAGCCLVCLQSNQRWEGGG